MVKKHVFLSYCHDNCVEVAALHAGLVSAREAVWWDKDIKPGQDWRHEIREAMKVAYAVVLCMSRETSARMQAGIYPEARDAIGMYRLLRPGGVFLIPVRLSNCDIPPIEIDDTHTLDAVQYIDLFPADRWPEGLKELIEAIRLAPLRP
jgi:hypothetical protein